MSEHDKEHTTSSSFDDDDDDERNDLQEVSVVAADDASMGGGDGMSISWKNIVYRVPRRQSIKKRMRGCCRRGQAPESITLLNNLSGCVPCGTLAALMGPSGSGKSTLLDVLAHRMSSDSDLSGDVLLGGQTVKRGEAKANVALVMQDDALNGVLTVRENLMYSARLRLPNMSEEEREARVEEVIADLGLAKVRDTKIGNVFFRGVSGGERRRCSIGMELVTRPPILLLDEPTSGLDSLSTVQIVQTLRQLARTQNCAVCVTIHQPSSEVFALFDRVMLLTRGEQAYFGPVKQMPAFFEASTGSPMPFATNPADWALSLINYDFAANSEKPDEVAHILDYYAESEQFAALQQCIDAQRTASDANVISSNKYETSFWTQLYWLCSRTFVSWMRDPSVVWFRLAMYSMLALLLATLYLRMDEHVDTIQDRVSILFFGTAFLSFNAVAALPAFLVEREIFVRERRNAYYSVGPFALSHSLLSVPFVFLTAAVFTAIFYYAVNLNSGAEQFFYYMLHLTLSLCSAEAIVMTISTFSPSFIIGLACSAATMGLFMLTCGFFRLAENMPSYYKYSLYYVSFMRYSFEGFMKNEFDGATFDADHSCSFPSPDNPPGQVAGSSILEFYGYEDVDKWAWAGVLVAFAFFFHFCFYLGLRFFNRGER